MKHQTFIPVLLLLGCLACQQDNVEPYASKDNVYFNYKDDENSLSYTFAYNPEKTADTLFLPLAIAGNRVVHDRKLKLAILQEQTTATAGLHFEPLQEYYVLPADSGKLQVPVILYNTDPELQQKTVSIAFTTAASEDFDVLFSERNKFTIEFSNRLERPLWWTLWEDQLANYSRVKHELYLVVVGNVDLLASMEGDAYLEIPRNLYLIDKLRVFLRDPFAWVAQNTQGYILEERADGGYDFYHTDNPARALLLQKNESDGRYYFIDENGQRVTMF
ncbi:DUF4843 domain-containing protein [Cesiribacter sp. SM1]|uniref:DUF4843 domain-containing protein n=1 Tax=Cesiribacter sp. SM1 TaxID=2861196 RepID=UPI001CD25BDD|nr:DUF4843 domain-containing protein [Cesiribacter sp. SM1]